MKNKYTFSDLCYDVLAKENAPLTPDAIWKKAVEIGLDKQLGTTGKTPSASIGARLYVDIRDNGEESKFVQVFKTFITNVNDSITIKKAKKNEYDEILDDEKYEKHIKDKKII